MASSGMRALVILALVVLAAVIAVGVALSRRAPSATGAKAELPYDAPRPPPPGAEAQGGPRPSDASGRKIYSCYLTRAGGTPWQSLVCYEPVQVPAAEVPGLSDVAARLSFLGQVLPAKFFRVDREGEHRVDNLGQPTHSLVSSKVYINPNDNVIIAYDIALTEGGLPQRLVGHRTKTGISIEFYRGAGKLDQRDLDFQPGTEIFPVTMDFVHYAFVREKDLKEFEGSFFVPEVMSFVTLRARPAGTELLAHQGRNRECARYDVFVGSSRAPEGVCTRQRVWFDVQMGTLLRRTDAESEAAPDEEQVTERVEPELIRTLQPLVIRPPSLPDKPFPYPLDRELVYTVQTRDDVLGKVRISFSTQPADKDGPAGYTSRARVDLEMPTAEKSRRQEEAVTRYDEHFLPLSYTVTGEEAVETVADYAMSATFDAGQVRLKLSRNVRPAPAPQPAPREEPAPPPGPQAPAAPPAGWQDPLRRVALHAEKEPQEAASPTPPARPAVRDEQFARPLYRGTLIYDFHRLEHLAVALFRLPLPLPPTPPAAPAAKPLSQAVAFFSVRQNQAARVPFAIVPEARPRAPEKSAATDEDLDGAEPPLFIATTTHPLMPSRSLLAPDGRLLQLRGQYGSQEIVYTLDDPIMRRRAERARRRPAQEGPVLIRPPWY